MDKKKILNQILDRFIGICIRVFFVHRVYVYLDFKKNPGAYITSSAPWYTGIIIYAVYATIAITVCLIVKVIINRKK